jgi:hypothetical protein
MTNRLWVVVFTGVCAVFVLTGARAAAIFAGLTALRYMAEMICDAIREAAPR